MTWRLLNDMMCFEEFKIQILLRYQVKCWTIHSHTYTLVIRQVKLHQHTHTHGMSPSLLQHPPWIIHQVQRWQTAIRSNLPSFKKKNQHRWVFLPILTQTDSNTCDSHVVWGETRWNETRQPPQCWAHFLRLRREKYKTRIIHRLDRHDTAFILLTQTLFSKYRFQKETDLFLNNHISYYFYIVIFPPCRCQM